MHFDLASSLAGQHLIVQPSDAALDPPESYLYVQDGLIISCGVLYALCYLFYIVRTIKDRTIAGPVEFMCTTMAYELYYGLAIPDTEFETACFLVWFLMDVSFVGVAVWSAYALKQRTPTVGRLVVGTMAGVVFLHWLCRVFPDEREQVTAYWVGWVLQLLISWSELVLLFQRGDTKGQSLEIWLTRYLGCYTAYGVFLWRYLNVPENWQYVGSYLSTALIVATLLPETIYPFVYLRVHRQQQKQKAA